MPLFVCSKCGCVENTALSRYAVMRGKDPLCSLCDPEIGRWHDRFPRVKAEGKYQPAKWNPKFVELIMTPEIEAKQKAYVEQAFTEISSYKVIPIDKLPEKE